MLNYTQVTELLREPFKKFHALNDQDQTEIHYGTDRALPVKVLQTGLPLPAATRVNSFSSLNTKMDSSQLSYV